MLRTEARQGVRMMKFLDILGRYEAAEKIIAFCSGVGVHFERRGGCGGPPLLLVKPRCLLDKVCSPWLHAALPGSRSRPSQRLHKSGKAHKAFRPGAVTAFNVDMARKSGVRQFRAKRARQNLAIGEG